jgi:hypothetical protein
MVTTTSLYTRQFSDIDGDLQQGQIIGFWDPTTAVLFGHELNAFGTAQVALASVVYTGTTSGTVHFINSAYSTLVLPDQNDAGGGQYGNPVPARHVAFCPISDTVAVLTSTVMQHSDDGPFGPATGIRSWVYLHVLRRASTTATSFTMSGGWLASTHWHYPGTDGSHDSYAVTLVGIAGTPTGAAAIGCITSWPQPTDKADSIGTIVVHDDNSIDLHWTGAFDNPGGFGRAAGVPLQAPMFCDGALRLLGADGPKDLTTPATGGASTGRPQIIGPGTNSVGWATFTATTARFASWTIDSSTALTGAPVTVPLTDVPIVAVDVLPGSSRLDYVQVTLTMSNAVQGDMETGSGDAYVYGAVVDFRGTPALRSDWLLLGTYTYGSQPQKVLAVVEDITENSIQIGWNAAAGGTGQGANTYDVFAGELLLGNTAATHYVHGNLPSGIGFTYQIVPVDPAGNRGEASDPVSATTSTHDAPPDTVAPSTPTLGIGGGDEHSVVLHAQSSDNVALGGFRIFDVTGASIPVQITGAGPDGVTTLDWRIQSPNTHEPYWLLDGQQHAFVAQAYDLAGNVSGYSTAVHATLASVAHPSETSLTVLSLTTTTISLSVVQATQNGSFTGVSIDIYRSGTKIATLPGDATSFEDTFVAHSKPVYSAQARNSAGWTSLLSSPVPQWGN